MHSLHHAGLPPTPTCDPCRWLSPVLGCLVNISGYKAQGRGCAAASAAKPCSQHIYVMVLMHCCNRICCIACHVWAQRQVHGPAWMASEFLTNSTWYGMTRVAKTLWCRCKNKVAAVLA